MAKRKSTRHRTIAVLFVLVVLAAGCTGAGGGAGGGDSGQSLTAGGGSADAGGGSYYANGERIIIREASMRVEVQTFDDAFDRAGQIAQSHGGYVAGWDHDIERSWDAGTLELRIPAGNFTAARNDLADLGTLESENVEAQDFTAEHQNLADQLEDLRAEREALQRLLEQTDDVDEARQLHDDLAGVRNQIRELESRQANIEQREALSTVRLRIHEPPSERPPRNYEAAFGFDDAFLDAFHGGLTALKYAIVAFGYAIPVGLAGVLLGSFGFGLFRVFQRVRFNLDKVLPSARPGGEGSSPAPTTEEDRESDESTERPKE